MNLIGRRGVVDMHNKEVELTTQESSMVNDLLRDAIDKVKGKATIHRKKYECLLKKLEVLRSALRKVENIEYVEQGDNNAQSN